MDEMPTVTAPSERVGKSTHLTFLLCFSVIAGFGGWASISPIDIVSMATGEVIPSTQVKTVQHLEGGIVHKINVGEGESVKRGQALVVLEPIASSADVAELQVRLKSLRIDEARIEALTMRLKTPKFPSDLISSDSALVANANEQFKAQIQRYNSEVVRQKEATVQQKEATVQRAHEIKEISTRIQNQRDKLILLREKIAISEALMRDKLTNKFQHIDLVLQEQELSGGIKTDRAALARARSALKETESSFKEAKAQTLYIKSVFDDDNQKALHEVRLTLGELQERVKKFEDSLARTVVRSPVDGIVKTLHFVTIGAVIRPGDPIAELVPAGDQLIIEAQLPTSDIGYVAEGQQAVIKLASADAQLFDDLNGVVASVSPDTLMTPDGMPFYKVRIIPQKGYFERGSRRHNLFPGMQMAVSIITGDRTIMEYILGPLIWRFGDALKER